MSHRLVSVFALALLCAPLAGCPSGPRGAGEVDRKETGLLTVTCDVADAVVWIDERMVGRIDEVAGGIRLRAGTHRLQVRHDRYHTRYAEVAVTRGGTEQIAITLAEMLD